MMLDGAMSKLLIEQNRVQISLSQTRIINASFIRLSDKYYSCIFIKTPNVYVPLGDCVEYVFFLLLVCPFDLAKKSNPNHTCTYTFTAQAPDKTIRV